jgi:hypothetical protein
MDQTSNLGSRNVKHWPAGTWFQRRLAEVKEKEAREAKEEWRKEKQDDHCNKDAS